MTTNNSNNCTRALWAVFIVLALALVLYPLSVGPAVWIVMHTESASILSAFDFLYRPLFGLAELNDTLGSWLSRYFYLWSSP